MKKGKLLFYALIISIMIPALPLVAQEENEEVYVDRIEVVGNELISAETIMYYMETREGDLYDERNLKIDFQNLWKTGLFSDLKIKSKDGLEGKIVIVEVTEQYVIDDIDFKGLEDVSSSELYETAERAGISLKRGTRLNMGTVSAFKQVIKEALSFKGYRAAEINVNVVPREKGRCDIVFDIVEGSSIQIEQLIFQGNYAFTDWEIRKVMEDLGNNTALSLLDQKDVFNDLKFARDVVRIRELYWTVGYLDVQISEPRLIPVETWPLIGKQKKKYIVEININEGKQYTVQSINVEGNKEFTSEEILSPMILKVGDIYNHTYVTGLVDFLQQQYGFKGYVMASIRDNRKKNTENHTVDLTLSITENDIYHLRKVEISGNTVTNDDVIRRQMLIAEGDVYDFKRIEYSKNRIEQLGFFEPQIELKPEVDNETKEVDLGIRVQERGNTIINFGIAYSELEGFFGTFSFETQNLFGSGNTFGISGQLGTLAETFSLNFSDPWFLGQRMGLGASIYIRNYDYPGYEDKRVGGTLTMSYPISDFWSGAITYNYQVVSVNFPEVTEEEEEYYSYYYYYYQYYITLYENYPWLFPEDELIISSIIKSFRVNTIDHPLFPTSGYKGSLSLEYGASWMGGTLNFFKTSVELVDFIRIMRSGVFGVRAQFGWIEPLGDEDAIPYSERFFLGGDRTIRGLNLRSVGGELNEYGVPSGGTSMLLFNFEYQILISNEMRLILFFDAGNAFSEDQDFSISNLRKSTGVEARIFMPVFNAPIRLIFAYNLDPGIYDDTTDFQFSMGMMF
ncbi:MAG: outer membrane protein assembly factor BamA [Acidobacteria bacterium]|nr:outer membrane protein assembly factor BamA [Acidobacteriota bacterium]